MADERCQVTVVFGKQTVQLEYAAGAADAVAQLKTQVAQRFGVEPQHQKLVLRGKELGGAKSPALTDGCKLLLLLNKDYHAAVRAGRVTPPSSVAAIATSKSASAVSSSAHTSLSEELEKHEATAAQAPPAPPSRVKKTPAIDVSELDADAVLVQLFRGKNSYDFIFPRSSCLLDVKTKLSAVLGMTSAQALRLVVKGKTPTDEAILGDLAGSARSLKCMALLQAQQHVVLEKQDELRELLNELAGAQATLQRLEKQIARNFMARDESLLQLSRVLDDGRRIASNLELVQHHLSGGAGGAATKAAKPRASPETLATVLKSIEEATSLADAAQALLGRHSAA